MNISNQNDTSPNKTFDGSISKKFHLLNSKPNRGYILEYSRDMKNPMGKDLTQPKINIKLKKTSSLIDNFKAFIPEKHAKNIMPEEKKVTTIDANNSPSLLKKNVKLYDEDFYH